MIVRTITTSNGATVRIHDDCMTTPGSAEERRVIEAQRRAAFRILSGKEDGESSEN